MIQANDFTKKSLQTYIDSGLEILNFIEFNCGNFFDGTDYYVDLKYNDAIIFTNFCILPNQNYGLEDIAKATNKQIELFFNFLNSSDLDEFIEYVEENLASRFGFFKYNNKVYDVFDVAAEEFMNDYTKSLNEYNKANPDFYKFYCEYINGYESNFLKPLIKQYIEVFEL